MDKKQTEALRIDAQKIAASLVDETGQISVRSSHLFSLIEGFNAARQEIASLKAQLYDQRAMGLCHVCGWKGVIDYPDGPVCVACEHDKALSPQPAAQAQAQHVHWVTPTIAQMKEYCKQASAMMARDLTRFDAACEVMGYLKEMRAPGYYMHRMNIVLHGNVEGTDAARASDKAAQPAAEALEDARLPLTDDEAFKAYTAATGQKLLKQGPDRQRFLQAFRLAENAHGITDQQGETA